jgi:predicted nucleic acid-binding protein
MSRPTPSAAGTELRRVIADAEPFALTGIVVTEVLQGHRRDVSRIEHYLSHWDMLEPVGYKTYQEAAVIFRNAQAKGVAVTTVDALIAPRLYHATKPIYFS